MKTQMTKQPVKGKAGQGGFTLIELLIVVAIIGVLAAIAIPQYGSYLDRASTSACAAETRAVATALSAAYAVDDDDDVGDFWPPEGTDAADTACSDISLGDGDDANVLTGEPRRDGAEDTVITLSVDAPAA